MEDGGSGPKLGIRILSRIAGGRYRRREKGVPALVKAPDLCMKRNKDMV